MSRHPTPPFPTDLSSGARPVNLKDGDLVTAVPLDDFMQELGILLRLPKRRITKAIPAIVEAPAGVRRSSVRAAALALTAVSLAATIGFARLSPVPAPEPLPVELRGEWRTGNPNYRQRVLSFTENRVGLSMSEGQTPSLHPILQLTSRKVSDTTVFAITYEDDGAPVDFRVSFVAGARPLLWLSNPPDVVWKPAGATARVPGATAVPAATGVGASAPTPSSGVKDAHPWEHGAAAK